MQTLPPAVARAAKAAENLQTKLKAGTVTVEDFGRPANAPTNPETGTARGTTPPEPGSIAAPTPPPETPPVPAPVAAPSAAPTPTPEQADWQHKFQVLQGKYNAEVPRLHEQLRALTASNTQMQSQLASTQTLLATLGQQQAVAPVPNQNQAPQRLTDDKEVKEFGPDLYDFIKRAAAESVLPQVGQLVDQRVAPVAQEVSRIIPAVQGVQQNQAVSAEQLLYTELDRLVPGWESINGTEPFGNWLGQVDPYAGMQRGAMLTQAFQNRDAPRVASFFIGFQKENAVANPATPATPAAAPPATPAVSLASLAAPGTGTGGPPAGAPDEAGKRTYTLSEIATFYRDVQRGAYKGRDKDAQRIERDIFMAQRQGRIRPR